MVNGKCISYIDKYRNVRWPTVFAAVPELGSRVRSMDGAHVLRVNDVIHGIHPETGDAEITIELVPRPMLPRA